MGKWKKKIFLVRALFFFNQQTTQTLKEKSNPNHKHQNAIAGLLLLSHNKNIYREYFNLPTETREEN